MVASEPRAIGEFFRIKHGYAFKGEFFAESGDFILLTPGNFEARGGLKLKGDKEKYYCGDIPGDFVLRKGDLVVAMTDLTQNAPILGAPAIIPEGNRFLHNQRLGKVVDVDAASLELGYLFYVFNHPAVRDQLKSTATGSTVRHTAPDRIYAVQAPVPPLPLQRRIVNILSAYDDLIENNARRITLLEEMVRSLYREWFVEFRFPGHAKVKRGHLPAGWSSRSLFDLASVTYGFPFKSKLFSTDRIGVPVVRIRDLLAGSSTTYTTESFADKYAVSDGDLLIGMDGNFHMSKWSGGTATLNQRVVMLRPTQVSRYFLFLALEQPIQHLEATITGTTVAHLSDQDLRHLGLVVAEPKVQQRFDAFVEPVYEQELVLRRKNAALRSARDLLLPRLVSGEIELSA